VNESLDTPLRLNAIRFIGAKHTRASFLSKLSSPYLVPPPDADPTQQSHALRHLLAASRSLTGLISQFDLFSEIEAGLERSPSLLSGREDVDLVFRVKEVPRYWLKSGGDIGNGEGSAVSLVTLLLWQSLGKVSSLSAHVSLTSFKTGSGRLRNVFGGGESLTGDVSFGTRTKSSFQLAFETPVNASPTTKADFSVFGAERDFSSWASCREKVKGIQARLKVRRGAYCSSVGNNATESVPLVLDSFAVRVP
jgi:outer membrane protein insertion porin family